MKRRTAQDLAATQLAYAVLEIKSMDDEKREIEGFATTPEPDRMGDIVEPEGAEYKLPLPLLWQHNSRQPIGEVIWAKVGKDGIRVRVRLAKLAEDAPQILKDRLAEAWHSVKSGLVRGFSIGFRSIEHSEMQDTWAYRFIKWEWLELSLVTIPANAGATITAIKSADQLARAALGAKRKTAVFLDDDAPGASGSTATKPKKDKMKTIKQQIADFEAKSAANQRRMEEIMSKSAETGSTLDEAETQEYDTLDGEVKSIDAHLVRLKALEKAQLEKAQQLQADQVTDQTEAGKRRAPSGIVSVRSNLEPGVKFARYAMALIRGKGNPQLALIAYQNDPVWKRSSPELEMVLKAAVAAGDTTTSGWASELVYADNLANEFIEYLRPKTIVGQIPNLRRVPFNIRVGGMSGGTTGYWVGQGAPIPVSKATTTSVSLAIAKAAGIVAVDNELARLSTPSAELMVRNDLAKAIIFLMDDSFINPNNGGVTNVSPASMTYGVAPITPTGTTYAAMRTDLQSMMETAFDANLDSEGSVWIMSQTLALKLSMMVNALDQRVSPQLSVNGGTFQGMPAIVSQAAQIAGSPQYNDILIWLHPQEVFFADDGQVTVEASREAALQLLDNPTNASTGGTVATSMISMFQTESMAIKAVRYVNWTKRRTTAAQFIQAAAYTG